MEKNICYFMEMVQKYLDHWAQRVSGSEVLISSWLRLFHLSG